MFKKIKAFASYLYKNFIELMKLILGDNLWEKWFGNAAASGDTTQDNTLQPSTSSDLSPNILVHSEIDEARETQKTTPDGGADRDQIAVIVGEKQGSEKVFSYEVFTKELIKSILCMHNNTDRETHLNVSNSITVLCNKALSEKKNYDGTLNVTGFVKDEEYQISSNVTDIKHLAEQYKTYSSNKKGESFTPLSTPIQLLLRHTAAIIIKVLSNSKTNTKETYINALVMNANHPISDLRKAAMVIYGGSELNPGHADLKSAFQQFVTEQYNHQKTNKTTQWYNHVIHPVYQALVGNFIYEQMNQELRNFISSQTGIIMQQQENEVKTIIRPAEFRIVIDSWFMLQHLLMGTCDQYEIMNKELSRDLEKEQDARKIIDKSFSYYNTSITGIKTDCNNNTVVIDTNDNNKPWDYTFDLRNLGTRTFKNDPKNTSGLIYFVYNQNYDIDTKALKKARDELLKNPQQMSQPPVNR